MNSKSISTICLAMLIVFAGFQTAGFAQTRGLKSDLFKGDKKLEACLISDPAHVMEGARGDHVRKIQIALRKLDNAHIDAAERMDMWYGPSTAGVVAEFKRKRKILNYKGEIDYIVGKKTIAALDREMAYKESLDSLRKDLIIPIK